MDDDEKVAEGLDFLQSDQMQVFRQIEPDGETGEDVHHADQADVFIEIFRRVDQDEDHDDTDNLDDEIAQHNLAEFFKPLEEPGDIEEYSDDVQCLIPVDDVITGEAGDHNIVKKEA